jgi:hypothetical protein
VVFNIRQKKTKMVALDKGQSFLIQKPKQLMATSSYCIKINMIKGAAAWSN